MFLEPRPRTFGNISANLEGFAIQYQGLGDDLSCKLTILQRRSVWAFKQRIYVHLLVACE